MSSDTPNPPAANEQAATFLKNSAIAGAIICPLAMLLPPRKLDIRFFVLTTGFSLSTNHLASIYTGESLYQRFTRRANALAAIPTTLPPEAQRTQQLLREHREREAAEKQKSESGIRKVANDVWMGGEDEKWNERRAQEHRAKFEEGKGMTGIIMDQIAEVWNGSWKPDSKKKPEEVESKSEK